MQDEQNACTVYVNAGGVFPPILAWDGGTEIGIKVESVADFLAANRLQRDVLGGPLAPSADMHGLCRAGLRIDRR